MARTKVEKAIGIAKGLIEGRRANDRVGLTGETVASAIEV
jgi:hypothetical protein